MGPLLPVMALLAFSGQVWGGKDPAQSKLAQESWWQHSSGPHAVQEAKFWPQIREDPWSRQSVTGRPSSLLDSPLVVAILASTVIVGAQLLPLLISPQLPPSSLPPLPSTTSTPLTSSAPLTLLTGEPSIVIVTGGYADYTPATGGLMSNVEMIPVQRSTCYLQDMPAAGAASTLVLTPQNVVLNCGGGDNPQSCLSLDVAGGGAWTHHSHLTNERREAIGVSLPSGTYLFGGVQHDMDNTDFLPASSTTWQAGPVPPGGAWGGCGVAVSDTEIVIIGGPISGDHDQVIRYNSVSNNWTPMGNLTVGRRHHACTLLHGNIIVAGGRDANDREITESTEIIPLSTGIPRPGGNLNTPRDSFAMVTLGGKYPKVLAIGGEKENSGSYMDDMPIPLAIIEEWKEDEEIWIPSPMNISTGRSFFGAIAIPSSLICPKN